MFNHRQSSMDCILRNLGERGARLTFAHAASLPDEFDLQVPRMERSFRARIVWRRRDELGVSFRDANSDGNVIPLDLAVRMRRLEADRARLQRRVSELSEG